MFLHNSADYRCFVLSNTSVKFSDYGILLYLESLDSESDCTIHLTERQRQY